MSNAPNASSDVIEVSGEIDIVAAPADIAGVMFDPVREPEWLQIVKQVEVVDPALVEGARVRRTGSVLGREVNWTTEVERVHFPHLLFLRVTDGPVLGSLRYDIQRSGGGSRVRVRALGELGVVPAFVVAPLKAALSADLRRLKELVETATA